MNYTDSVPLTSEKDREKILTFGPPQATLNAPIARRTEFWWSERQPDATFDSPFVPQSHCRREPTPEPS